MRQCAAVAAVEVGSQQDYKRLQQLQPTYVHWDDAIASNYPQINHAQTLWTPEVGAQMQPQRISMPVPHIPRVVHAALQ
jgi:hypothetical protein